MWGKFTRASYAGAGDTKVPSQTTRVTGGSSAPVVRFTDRESHAPNPAFIVGNPMTTGGPARVPIIPGVNGPRVNSAEFAVNPRSHRNARINFIP